MSYVSSYFHCVFSTNSSKAVPPNGCMKPFLNIDSLAGRKNMAPRCERVATGQDYSVHQRLNGAPPKDDLPRGICRTPEKAWHRIRRALPLGLSFSRPFGTWSW